ncbi:3-oxoacyl-ACP reductase FabG [Pseudohoeflea coraliihabitans]|uniref:3-oxoacyl-ACP reductase FabG n=1 Tax=Pseudohoeflea coraliihabitans TaxID=2860393 RepID=A0ABS6WK17_9HYPH|nr:3-oxoacyl-ACP reductase FabG [Pseudohoeflea sp. DP4N28-3]MBW3095802.1 3-oxoacyl-ACP reductase FabG [Pseudohoeflea sp. DP4N28-3]
MSDSNSVRTAVVTGAARGIGRAIAERFAREGARVVILDLDGAASEVCASEIAAAHGGEALGMGCDVSDRASVEAAMAKAHGRFGSIDILVNNAGVTRDNLIHKMSDDDWDLVMGVHLRGTFVCTSTAQRYMVEQRYGKIVNISSTSSLGNRGQLNYSTAKAGLQGFTRTLALELGRFNINVNCIAPGFIDTEMTQATAKRLGFTPEEYKAKRAETIAIRRVGVPEDVANLARFLCDDEASYVNGQVIYLSGGPETRR